MARNPREVEATAWHEAGHAVAAVFLPTVPKVRRVTIVPDEKAGSLGHTLHWYTEAFWRNLDEGGWSPRTQVRMHEEIIMLLAGGFAEKRKTGRANHVGARSDYAKAADLVLGASADERTAHAMLRWLRCTAESLVEVHWKQIGAVAAALLREKTINGARLREIMFPPVAPEVLSGLNIRRIP
jgi:hypothetical protein